MTQVKIQIDAPLAQDDGTAPDGPLLERIIHALRGVYDPELPVNLYDLGLIYGIDISDDNTVNINMTLTAPNCPVADKIPEDVATAVRKIEDVKTVNVTLIWEPKWTRERMSDAAKIELGWF